jgi:hypothetical protein
VKSELEASLTALQTEQESSSDVLKLDMEIKLHEARREVEEVREEAQHQI